MTEIPKGPPKEIDPAQKEAFRAKVALLILTPDTQMPGQLRSFYQQKGTDTTVTLSMPVPGRHDEHVEYRATVEAYSFSTPEGNRVVKERSITYSPHFNDISYSEKDVIYDHEGNRVRHSSSVDFDLTQVADPDELAARDKAISDIVNADRDGILSRARSLNETNRLLGARIVTEDRYRDMMDVLNSLTPEDEVKAEA